MVDTLNQNQAINDLVIDLISELLEYTSPDDMNDEGIGTSMSYAIIEALAKIVVDHAEAETAGDN